MYSLTLNLNTKVTPWHESHTKTTNFITRENGASEFYDMFDYPYASIEYIIKPDFTWEQVMDIKDSTLPAIGSEFFTSKGIYEDHECGVHINENISYVEREKSSIINADNKSLTIDVTMSDHYSINFYTISGKRVYSTTNQRLHEGHQVITFANANLSQGFYIAELSWSSGVVREKFYIQ